jgi:macrolide-specific efflux system membrane fusion protein
MRLKLLALVGLLVIAGGAVFFAVGGFGPPATAASTLLTTPAAIADVTDEIAATGTIEAASQYALAFGQAPTVADGAAENVAPPTDPVASGVSWLVAELHVAVGDRVTEGQVLATADTTDLEAQIAEASRAAKSAALQLKQATEDRADASTTAAKRQTQVALYNAQTADVRAKADLAALEALRDHVTLVAPADGIVTKVAISPGAAAQGGTAIALISTELLVSTSVVESDIAAIQAGQEASVSVAALDATLRGRVTSIDPFGSGAGSGAVVSFAVDVTLDAPPAGLRPGMSADITIVAASATNVLSIPSRALTGSAGSYTVRVVAADGAVSTRPVEVGLVTSSLAEIKSGLQAGELVVTGTSNSQNGLGGVQAIGGGPLPGGGVIRGETKP